MNEQAKARTLEMIDKVAQRMKSNVDEALKSDAIDIEEEACEDDEDELPKIILLTLLEMEVDRIALRPYAIASAYDLLNDIQP